VELDILEKQLDLVVAGTTMVAFVLIIQAIFVVTVCCETFTSIEHLASNLLAEETLIKSLEELITSEDARLRDLKLKLDYFKTKNAEAEDVEAYLANPINAFQLIKRLTLELSVVEAMAGQNGYPAFVETVTELRQTLLPAEEDLVGAGAALIRLQDTYDLKTSDFSEGVINGVRYNVSLTVEDCLEIGKLTYNVKDFYHAVLWLREALRRFEVLGASNPKLKESILAYLAPSFYKAGHVKAALQVAELMVALDPDNQKSQKYIQKLMKKVKKLKEKPNDDLAFNDIHLDRRKFVVDLEDYKETRMYELLCQGKTTPPTKDQQNLNCRYIDDRSPFIKIAPLKVEEVHRNPDIVLFHEVLSESEIAEIKELANQKLHRATVFVDDEVNSPAVFRISKFGWLEDSESERVRTLSRRVEDMTGMTVETAEELQVVNYGIGGQYVPHCDETSERKHLLDIGVGYRVSTLLFYVSIYLRRLIPI
jgi:prolyl 4-hydroxylase